MKPLVGASAFAARWFGPIILAAALAGLAAPPLFLWVRPWIAWLLAVIMLGMGMTLSVRDFSAVLSQPRAVAIGLVAQYAIMPGLAFAIARVLQLSPELTVGVILVGACPGGTASNVIAYLARANVALSVTLTALSTLLAPLLTPALTVLLASRDMDVPAAGLFVSVLQVVAIPVALGVGTKRLAPRVVERCLPALPLVSVGAIALIVAAVVGASRGQLFTTGAVVAVAVVLHNGAGLALGYGAARLFRLDVAQARTTSIEVGMQNSGLAVALASAHFGPVAALPGAVFSVWHNLSGSLLAGWWSRTPAPAGPPDPAPVLDVT